MISVVVSGFQTGVDIAAIRAARSLGIKTDGWMPLGYKTEAGPRSEYATLYGAREHPAPQYPPRTHANVELAQATIWYGPGDSEGFGCTIKAARTVNRPFLRLEFDDPPGRAATWIKYYGHRSVNCAGSRASRVKGIEARAEAFFREVFRLVNGIEDRE